MSEEIIDIQLAMENLASIASIDKDNTAPLGIMEGGRLVTNRQDFGPDTVEWLSGEGAEPIVQLLDLTYQAIHQHLVELDNTPEMDWNKDRKAVAAMMALVGESVAKIEKYLYDHLGKEIQIRQRPAFAALQQFYQSVLASRLTDSVLSNIDEIRADTNYELFYIRNENNEPYFNRETLRHVKLVCDFEVEGEDPLLQIRPMQDRDLHASAGQILGECHDPIADFYSVAKTLEGNELVKSLSMALSALFLAANPRYLLPNTTFKSCLQYFYDFHRFVRRAMHTTEYQKLIAYPPDRTDKVSLLLLELTHMLCKAFFVRVGGVKTETIGLIHRTMRAGEEMKQKEQQKLLKGDTVWNQLLLDDEKYRKRLSFFPSGPLFKILDLIHEEQDDGIVIAFDPLVQENIPSKIYEIQVKSKKIEVLRLASPTRQSLINKAEVVEEFQGFVRSLKEERHLLINLQDRTSWKEFARCKVLEGLSKSAEFSQRVLTLTLPKATDFYFQAQEYLELGNVKTFKEALFEQVNMENGFFFPAPWKKEERLSFATALIEKIHQLFFQNKKELSRRNREDFIELFYHLLILKAIDQLNITSLSFTCKDALDIGPAAQGMFYGFLTLLTGDFSKKESLDFLRWLLYAPALFVRERAILPERFTRAISFLDCFDGEMAKNGKAILKELTGLYHPQFLQSLFVKHL